MYPLPVKAVLPELYPILLVAYLKLLYFIPQSLKTFIAFIKIATCYKGME